MKKHRKTKRWVRMHKGVQQIIYTNENMKGSWTQDGYWTSDGNRIVCSDSYIEVIDKRTTFGV